MAHSESNGTTGEQSSTDDGVTVRVDALTTALAAAREERRNVLTADGEGPYTRELTGAINQLEIQLARSDDHHDWSRVERLMVGRYQEDPTGEGYYEDDATGEALIHGETVYFAARLFQTGDPSHVRWLAAASKRKHVLEAADCDDPAVLFGKGELDHPRRGDDPHEGDAVIIRQPRPVDVTLTE